MRCRFLLQLYTRAPGGGGSELPTDLHARDHQCEREAGHDGPHDFGSDNR